MQHFYTCFSGLFSNLRTSIAQVQRTRYSVSVHSLRTIILLFVLALSCNVWGDVYYIGCFGNVSEKGELTKASSYSNLSLTSIKYSNNTYAKTTEITYNFSSDKNGKFAGSTLTDILETSKWSSGSGSCYAGGIKLAKSSTYSITLPNSATISKVTFIGYPTGKNGTIKIASAENTLSAKQFYKFEISNISKSSVSIEIGTTQDLYGIFVIETTSASSCTAPTITAQPVSATYSVGAASTPLQVAATGEGTLTYQWQSSTDNTTFADITGETRATYTPPADKAGTTYYRCIVFSGSCSTTSDPATITIAANNTVYLRPTDLWNADNARFAVYYWDASNTGWADMTRVSECEEVYMAQIPANYTNIIFCRMQPSTDNNWNNKWNQTVNLSVEDGNVYTITGGSKDNYTGSWSTYTPATFSVSFDANGGDGTITSITDIACGGTATLTENTFTRTNYTFAGWNTQADGNGTAYADKASITNIKTDITLYAQWTGVDYWYVSGNFPNHDFDLEYRFTDNQVAITLAANTTYEFKIQHQEGNTYTWFGNSGTMTSANCTGWNFYTDAYNARITTTVAGAYIFTLNNTTPNISVTYPALYTIQYAANMPTAWGKVVPFYAANIPTETASVGYGASYTISANTPAINVDENTDYAIYTFAGWNTQADGKGTTYSAGGTIPSVSGDITLYAQWTPHTFKITYYDDDQTTILYLTPNTYTYPVSTTFPTHTKHGYSFLGWKTSPTATDYITKTDTYYGDFTLYAEWKKETILYTDTYIWQQKADATGCVVDPNGAANANQEEVCTEKTYSSSTIGGGNSMGRPDNVGEYSITIAAQPGYLIQSICTYGKVETASKISWDKGITWTDLATYTEQKKVFTAPTGGAKSFIIKCTTTKSGSGGIWWRNALVTLIEGLVCTPLTTFAWDASSATYTYGEPFTAPKLSVQSGTSGTILYASSDASVATIATDGTLTPKMPGTTTISATYEGDDFCPTTVTYTLHVVCNATAPKIVSDGTETTVGCAQTITLRAVQSTDGTAYTTGIFQWYRDGEEISGSTASTIVVKVPGNYTVAYDNGVCSVMSTNTAKVTASGSVPEVTRLARYQYFRVSGAYLESQKMRHLFRVKPTATGTPCQITVKAVHNNTETDVTGLANVTDYVSFVDNNDGTYDVMLDLNKLQTTVAITGTLSEGDILVFSCAPAACTEGTFDDAYAKSIDVRVLGADKKALAFIVSGANGEGSKDKKNHVVGGDFIDGVNKADLYLQTGHYTVDRTKELPLLTTLKKTYHVDPVNGYAAFDPMNYEPYDLIVLTDFPQASKSIKAAQNLDAIGNMVDVRPMLSLKAHMVRDNLSNGVWKTQKGFTENAVTPDPEKQTVMSILCYAHSMFDGFSRANLSDGTTWTQADSTNALTNIMVDNAQNIYIRMLTKGGFENSKSLQGFTAVASENFINIGTIPDKTHTSLITCCERQANLEARLMLLSINSHATSLLTEVGMKAIERILTYLLVTDPTKVSDCSIVFDNGFNPDGTSRVGCTKHDGMWNTSENWNSGLTPLPTQNVQIKADVTVVGQATAADVKIQPTKKLTIAPNGALSTNGIIGWLDPKNNATISAITDPTVITVQANENNTGALIQSDKEGKTQATIQMYSRAKGTDKGNGMVENAVWQWMTTPYKDVTHAVNTYRGAWLYTYNNSTHSWQQIYDQSPVPPFAGYSITQAQAKTYTMTGTLVPTADQTISLSNGINLIGNSWTAPINISQFKVEDFANAEATIVMFNTGIDPDGSGAVYTDENSTASQTYVSIPVNAAIAINELKVIPAMQAFQVKATAEGATLTLDYDRLVRTKQVGNSPMRAPKHNAQTLGNGINERLRISVIGKRYSDYLYLLSHEEATEGFDNGWDGEKIYSDNLNVPVIYVENAAGDWQISTQPVLAGTQFGFYRGEDDVYTIRFDYVGDETLYFYDAVADTYTEVKTGNTYSFISTTDNLERRFALTNFNPYVKPTPTDIDNTDAHSARMIRKFVLNDHIYILIDGVLYDVVGKMVR